MPLLLAGATFPYSDHLRYFDREITPRLGGNIRFIGAADLATRRELLRHARALLVPSQIDETSSLVAMEALASGTPVIAFRAGALPEIVRNGRTGFLVDSVAEMAAAIGRAGEIDRNACRAEAERRFDARTTVRGYFGAYEQLAGGAPHVQMRLGDELRA